MRAIDWLFRSRQTGKYTIAQFPNVPLLVFLGAAVLRVFLRDGSRPHDVVSFVATGALMIWAVDEVVRGVNPWRRSLGAFVLVSQVIALVR
jgi:predicted neutral ceramidase superfamily lipid hydrolase